MSSAYKYQGRTGRGSVPLASGCHCYRCNEAAALGGISIIVSLGAIAISLIVVALMFK